MAPLKYEDKMKDKLERRVIQPSVNAWNVLTEKLDASEKKSKKIVFWRMGIAASIVGLLWISISFFSDKNIKQIEPQIVDVEKIKPVEEPLENSLVEESKVKNVIAEIPSEKIKTTPNRGGVLNSKNKEPEINSGQGKSVKKEFIIEPKEDLIAVVEVGEEEIEKREEKIIIKTIEEQKIEQVVAQILELKKQNNSVSDIEIEDLLNNAQKDIALEKLVNKNENMIDANALLQDVEDELNRSFRQKVWDALEINYHNIKTAVAQRNE